MKIFEEWIVEAITKEFKFSGWKKITKTQFINALANGKSISPLNRFMTYGNTENVYTEASKAVKSFSSILMSIVKNMMKDENNWRTVLRSSNTSVMFSNNSKLDLSQMGDKLFYEQEMGDGVMYLYINHNFNEDWEEHSIRYMFYYVEER